MKLAGVDIEIVKTLDFNTACELAQYGHDLLRGGNQLSMMRAFVALSVGDVNVAGQMIEKHIIDGGDLIELMEACGKAIDESGFIKALMNRAEPKTTAPRKKSGSN